MPWRSGQRCAAGHLTKSEAAADEGSQRGRPEAALGSLDGPVSRSGCACGYVRGYGRQFLDLGEGLGARRWSPLPDPDVSRVSVSKRRFPQAVDNGGPVPGHSARREGTQGLARGGSLATTRLGHALWSRRMAIRSPRPRTQLVSLPPPALPDRAQLVHHLLDAGRSSPTLTRKPVECRAMETPACQGRRRRSGAAVVGGDPSPQRATAPPTRAPRSSPRAARQGNRKLQRSGREARGEDRRSGPAWHPRPEPRGLRRLKLQLRPPCPIATPIAPHHHHTHAQVVAIGREFPDSGRSALVHAGRHRSLEPDPGRPICRREAEAASRSMHDRSAQTSPSSRLEGLTAGQRLVPPAPRNRAADDHVSPALAMGSSAWPSASDRSATSAPGDASVRG